MLGSRRKVLSQMSYDKWSGRRRRDVYAGIGIYSCFEIIIRRSVGVACGILLCTTRVKVWEINGVGICVYLLVLL